MPSKKPATSPHRRRNKAFLLATTWIAGVLSAAASILFGVWAPLSYKAAANGNRDNNTIQSSMLSSLSVANSVAQVALSSADAQASLLQDMQSRLEAMGQLALIQYCASQTVCFLFFFFFFSLFFFPINHSNEVILSPHSLSSRPLINGRGRKRTRVRVHVILSWQMSPSTASYPILGPLLKRLLPWPFSLPHSLLQSLSRLPRAITPQRQRQWT